MRKYYRAPKVCGLGVSWSCKKKDSEGTSDLHFSTPAANTNLWKYMNPHFVEKNVANLIIYPSTAVRDLKVWLDVYAYDYIKQQANKVTNLYIGSN